MADIIQEINHCAECNYSTQLGDVLHCSEKYENDFMKVIHEPSGIPSWCPKIPKSQLNVINVLTNLSEIAKEYRKRSSQDMLNNTHLTNVRDVIEQPIIDGVLVDYINHIAIRYGVDYGFSVNDLMVGSEEIRLDEDEGESGMVEL